MVLLGLGAHLIARFEAEVDWNTDENHDYKSV